MRMAAPPQRRAGHDRRDPRVDGSARPDRSHQHDAGGDRVRTRRHDHPRQRRVPRRGGLHHRRGEGPSSPHVRRAGLCARATSTRSSGRTSTPASSRRPNTSGIGKGGKEIWIQASYTPTMDFEGKPFKVVKYATDVTAQKTRNADFEGQLAAISKAQAVIEFNLDGTVLTANENFLARDGLSPRRGEGPASPHVRRAGVRREPRIRAVLGRPQRRARIRPLNTSAWARAARKSGSRRPTTRSST